MNKSIYRFISVIVGLTLIIGNHYNASASPSSTSTNIYYVSTTGSDSNPGTSAAPFKTIQKAANTAKTGDSVMVLAGNYAERITVNRALTFQAQGTVVMNGFTVEADNVTIKGFEITNTPDNSVSGWGIFLRGSNCDIENNYIHYATRGGISIADPSIVNCVIRNNQLYRNALVGIDVRGKNHLIENNEIWGTIQYHPNWINPPSWVDADGIHFFGSGHIFRGNYIHDILYTDPQNVNPHIDCFQTWAESSTDIVNNIVFEQNICDNLQAESQTKNGQGFMLEGGVNHLYIINNIIKAYLGINTGGTGNAHHLYIYNNLLINSPSFSSFWPAGMELFSATYSDVINNIFYNQPQQTILTMGDKTGQTIDYNLAYNSNGSAPQCIEVDNFVCMNPAPIHDLWNVDPKFVNPSSGDYHLQSNSPAIGAGMEGSDIGVYGVAPITLPPPMATLVSPSGSLGTNYNPTYTWNQVSTATQYYLYVNGPSGNVLGKWYTTAEAGCNGLTCSVTPGTTLGGGNFNWQVLTYNSAGAGPWSSPMSFSTTIPTKPAAATLVSPTGSIGTNYNPTYTWNQVATATQYYLYVTNSSGMVFGQWYTTAQASCNGTICSATPSTTLGGGNFTWQVLTYNSAGYTWSSLASFSTTIPTKPVATTLVSPSGSSSNHNPTFTWNQVSNAAQYYLYVTNASGTVFGQWYTTAQASCNGTTCSATPGMTFSSGNFSWQVLTYNSAGGGPWSSISSFTITP